MNAIERRNRAATEAADWWALLQGDDMTHAEREAFIGWLRDSPTHVAEMLRLAQVHGALGQFHEWADISTERSAAEDRDNIVDLRAASKTSEEGAPKRAPRAVGLLVIAAALAAVSLIIAWVVPQLRGQSIVTERGERREVVLDDGSIIKVDPQTQLRVQYAERVRRVRMTEGRALFRVAKDATRPFVVEVGETTVRAVGTAFGVEQRRDDIVVVTVSEGRVAVSRASQPPGETELLLEANEQTTVARASPLAPVRDVQSERELAWADGRLVFRNDPISRVVAEFNRYNRVQLRVPDAALAARPVTGVFDASNPEAFIAFMESVAPVTIERSDARSIVIEPR